MADQTLPSKFDEVILEAIVELLEAYGLNAKATTLDPALTSQPMLTAAIPFVGSGLKGCLTLMAERKVFTSMQDWEWDEAGLRDWIGEIGNQALGSIRRKLVTRGLNADMGLPVVQGAVRLALEGMDERFTRAHAFETPIGTILVCIDVAALKESSIDWNTDTPPIDFDVGLF